MQFDPTVRNIFLDIEEVYQTAAGKRVVNAMMASKGEMFQTSRGHLALILRLDVFEKLRNQLRLELAEGLDGLKVLSVAKAAAKAA